MSFALSAVFDNRTRHDLYLPRATCGQQRVVCDQQQRHGALCLLGEEEIGNLASGFRIQVACRLVRDQYGGRRRQRSRDGDTLLLSA